MRAVISVFLLCGAACAHVCGAATVLVEAESFANKGGWAVDQQFMDQMGSPFLLAHGLGVPVADAETSVNMPETGTYRVWARTRNWVASWNTQEAPGKFRIGVNGKELDETLGTQGAEWAWQFAGSVPLEKGPVRLSLHDLTGFDGRCDALILSSDAAFKPEADVAKLDAFRRQQGAISRDPEAKRFDLIIAGGGIPGVCMALSAARLGVKVALLQDRPVLGGNNSSEVRVHLGGRANLGPYPKLGDVLSEISPAKGGNARPAGNYEDARKLKAVQAEPNIALFLSTRALAVEMSGNKISAVIGRNIETGREIRFEAPLVADCTGDGVVGALAGAEFRMGREGGDETGETTAPEKADALTMGSSVQWYSSETQAPVAFPDIAWGLPFTDATCERIKMGDWMWETGMRYNQISAFERIRDYGMLVVYSNWSFLKNKSTRKAEFAKRRLDWVAYVAGKRESRRLVGDLVLNEQDLVNRTAYPDGTACTTWTVDLHYPDPKNTKNFPGEEFKSIAKHKTIYPYPIPYRCLYSRNIDNLFMAGRDISVTHVALGTVRVMRTGGMMGEVVGMASSVCKKYGCSPREVYLRHLDELKALMTKGVGSGKPQPPQTYNLGGSLLKPAKKK